MSTPTNAPVHDAPPVALSPHTQAETDLATYREADAPDYRRLSAYDLVQIAQLHGAGRTQVQIAAAIGCSQPAVSYALKRLRVNTDDVRAALRAVAPDMVDVWVDKAKKSADHRGARELIEAAHPELRPQPAVTGAGGGVTVIVGTPGAPVRLPDVTIVQAPSPAQLEAKSETD